jgi:5-methylcytosine-specific restriction protein B
VELLAAELQNQIIQQLMENIKLSPERQTQIKALWEKFKSETKQKIKTFNSAEIDKLACRLGNLYKDKIINDTLEFR